MSAPTPHQLLLALSKVRLPEGQRVVLDYLAAFTVAMPPREEGEWVVGASLRTIAEETGRAYTLVRHAVWGDKRADRSGQRGLVELSVIRCWAKGRGQNEAVFSVNGNFDEWAIEWATTTRAERPATRREVLLELRNAGLGAPWGDARPQFFGAPWGGAKASGRKGKTERWLPLVRRKGRIGFGAPWGGASFEANGAPWGGASFEAGDGCAPFSLETSSPASKSQQQQSDQQPPENPAATELVAELGRLTKRKLWGAPVDAVVHAVCDNNVDDVGFVIAELRRHADAFGPQKWKGAVDLTVQLLNAGPPRTARPGCESCGGRGIVFDEDADVARACPACRPDAA